MGQSIEIRVPDIGDFEDVEVVEILVSVGDAVAVDDPLVSIESDKATMEIPATEAGVITEMRVAVGDRVSEGSVLALLDAEGSTAARDAATASEEATGDAATTASEEATGEAAATASEEATGEAATTASEEATGDSAEAASQAAEPASAEAPNDTGEPRREAWESGSGAEASEEEAPAEAEAGSEAPEDAEGAVRAERVRQMSAAARDPVPDRTDLPHASPLVRRYARELGVPVEETEGTGPHGRVLVEDVQRVVRERFAGGESSASAPATPRSTASAKGDGGAGIPALPKVDHAAFGPVHEEPLSRIQRVAGPALHRSWLNVPHVTQHEEADVTELERFRRDRREAAAARGLRLSPLLFVMKAVAGVLREFPKFRSALAPEGDRLVVKDYYHLGIAVDTEQGLVVPVIRDVDRKGVFELAGEVAATAERARAGKLGPADLSGAVFTISSLGGIGGTHFTPIVNAPEVAILGLSEMRVRPRWQGPDPLEALPAPTSAVRADDAAPETGRFEPRVHLPLSLSYDHRVIDGADAARFTSLLAHVLGDPRRLLL